MVKKKVRTSVSRLLQDGKFTEAIDWYTEKAKKYREEDDFEKAIGLAEKGRDLALEKGLSYDGSFCERQLCEIHALLGHCEKCIKHADNYRRLADQSKNPSQKQLSHHVTAWCIEKLFDKGVVGTLELETALKHVETSKELLEEFKSVIKNWIQQGTVTERRLGLQNLEAQIYQLLGNEEKALQILSEAERCLPEGEDSEHMKYELILTKIGLAAPKDRLKLAEQLVKYAPNKKKGLAFLELSHQLVVNNQFNEGYIKLRQVYCEKNELETTDRDDIEARLPILYKIFQYQRELKHQSSLEKYQIYEAIADLYDKYYQPLSDKEKKEYSTFARKNIVNNYRQVIEFKRDVKDELRALNGIALVFMDMGSYAEARIYFEKRLELLEANGMDRNWIMDVKLSLFQCHCKLATEGVTKMFTELEACLTFPNHRRELFDVWSTYCATIGEQKLELIYRQKANEIEEISVKNEDDETDVLFGNQTNEEILEMCYEEYQKQLKYGKMLRKKGVTNKNGETGLHEAAKESDSEMVEYLCKAGYDVNAKDNGGWTPLLEAVAEGELDNVRVLLKYGANVNCASEANVEDNASSRHSRRTEAHSRITPLMDACCNGHVDIARVLMENNADLRMRDSVGWSAFNHLNNFIKENGADDEQREFLEFLRDAMNGKNVSLEPIRARRRSSPPVKFNTDVYAMDDDDDCLIIPSTSTDRIRKRPCSEEFRNPAKRFSTPKPPSLPSRPPPSRSPIYQQRTPPQPVTPVRQIVDLYQTPQRRSVELGVEMIVVILIFDCAEIFDKMKVQFLKSAEIGDVKNKIFEDERKRKFPKITIFEQTQSGDRFELNDDFKLSMSTNNEITLVCKLAPLTALEMYRKTVKDPVNEVCQRFEVLSTRNVLNLSHLFLSATQLAQVFEILKESELPDELVLDLSRCDLSTQDELALKVVAKVISCLTMHATKSTTNFEFLFKAEFLNLKTIEVSSVEVRDQALFSNILSNSLLEKVSLIKLQCRTTQPSPIIEKLEKLENLTFLDISGTNWITESDWVSLLESLKMVRKLNMNDVEMMVEFEAEWLPKLTELQLRRSKLKWSSFIEWLSTASTVTRIDLRASLFDDELLDDLSELKCSNNLVVLQ